MRSIDEKTVRTKALSMPAILIAITAISLLTSSAVIISVEEGYFSERERIDCLKCFHLEAEPVHRNSSVNENVTYQITLATHIYLYAPCYLTVLDMFDGVVSSIEPNVIYPGDVATLELTAMFEGDFIREVVGTYNHQTDSVKVTLKAEDDESQIGTGKFELIAEPTSQTVNENRPATYSISIEPGEDFQGKIELEVLDCFDGVISVIRPEIIGPDETAVLVLTPMISGEFSRIVIGKNNDCEESIEVFLTVHDRKSYQN